MQPLVLYLLPPMAAFLSICGGGFVGYNLLFHENTKLLCAPMAFTLPEVWSAHWLCILPILPYCCDLWWLQQTALRFFFFTGQSIGFTQVYKSGRSDGLWKGNTYSWMLVSPLWVSFFSFWCNEWLGKKWLSIGHLLAIWVENYNLE